ncbi:MAG TPA: hypothetical protein DIW86_10120 [Pseudomonas sp.]|nr:hypothetical protein [Pseudomonas sp.]
MLWRGSLLPLGCIATPNQAISLHQAQGCDGFGSASHSSGSKLPRHIGRRLRGSIRRFAPEGRSRTAQTGI